MTPAEYKTLRASLGTQADVAALLGVARSTISDRERGAMEITKEAAFAIKGASHESAKPPAAGLRPVSETHSALGVSSVYRRRVRYIGESHSAL